MEGDDDGAQRGDGAPAGEGCGKSSERAGRSAAPCPKSRACTISKAASCKGLAGAAGED